MVHDAIKPLCEFQETLLKNRKPKREVSLYTPDKFIVKDINDRVGEKVKAISIFDKLEDKMLLKH